MSSLFDLGGWSRPRILCALFAGGLAALFAAPTWAQTTPPGPPGSATAGLGLNLVCREDVVMGRDAGADCWLTVDHYDAANGPVTVVLPDALSEEAEYAVHANGMVLISMTGEREPRDVQEQLPILHFNAYACEPRPFDQRFCNDQGAKPGAATVPVIVKQAGLPDTRYDMVFDIKPPTIDRDQTQNRLGNRYHIGHFLNIHQGPLESGEILIRRGSAIWYWENVDLDKRLIRFQSAWKPGQYLTVIDGRPTVAPIDTATDEGLWVVGGVDNVVPHGHFFRFQDLRTGLYLNVADDGTVTVDEFHEDWLSEQWWVVY